jgi:hypothetical protein
MTKKYLFFLGEADTNGTRKIGLAKFAKQALGYILQALGYILQALGYILQALG